MTSTAYVMRPQERVDAVLDTDAYNEIDDQFAIAYLLASPDRVNLEAIYAAPFQNKKATSPAEGMEKSYHEVLKLLTLAQKPNLAVSLFRGSTRYLPDEKTPIISAAAQDLCERAERHTPHRPLYVLAIGAITNVASALLINPAIAANLVIVWLGGHAYHHKNNLEFNAKQDVAAARVVFNSNAALVQLPCVGVVDTLTTTEPELRYWLSGKNALCDYLVSHTVEEAETYARNKPWSRVIWDISAVAWLLDTEGRAVLDRCEHRPILQYDHHYSFSPDRPSLNYVYQIRRDAVFEDLFRRLASLDTGIESQMP